MNYTGNRRAGVTLIEILVAVSILALLSTGILMAMRIGFNTLDKTDAHLVHNRRIVNARRIVENQINGFLFTDAEFRPRPEVSQLLPFREFGASRMRFVTTYSLEEAWRGRARVLVMQVIPGENNRGVRLIANEIPWTGPAQTGSMVTAITPEGPVFAEMAAGQGSFVLADRLAYCRFWYQVENPQIAGGYMWVAEYRQQNLPRGVRIEMEPLEKSTSELGASSITVRFPVSRLQGHEYVDQ